MNHDGCQKHKFLVFFLKKEEEKKVVQSGTVIIITDLGFGVFGEILLRVNMNHRVSATLIRSGTQGVQ